MNQAAAKLMPHALASAIVVTLGYRHLTDLLGGSGDLSFGRYESTIKQACA
jgi:hypothetical protein